MEQSSKKSIFIKSNCFYLVIVLTLSLFFSILKLSRGYSFEWDQADDATKVFSMISQKKPLLIGPRVSNDNGFFVGPYHYYFLLPFYLITNNDPVAGMYAVVFINSITVIISYIFLKNIFTRQIAFITTVILSACLGTTCWSVMYSPLITIATFYICYRSINYKFSFPLAMLFAGFISNIHLVSVSLIPIILLSFFISKNRPSLKQTIIGLIFFVIPFTPIIFFDLRHDFLNFNKVVAMIFNQNLNGEIYIKNLYLRSFWRSLNIFNVYKNPLIERVFSLIIILFSPFLFKGKKNKLLIILWIVLPLVFLSQYNGAISEYYYIMIYSLIPLFITLIIVKLVSKKIINYLLVILLITTIGIKIFNNKNDNITLDDKKAIVNYLVNQKRDQPFYLSYEIDTIYTFGFDYLFMYNKNIPQKIDKAHLYTLFTKNNLPPNSDIVFNQKIYYLVRR